MNNISDDKYMNYSLYDCLMFHGQDFPLCCIFYDTIFVVIGNRKLMTLFQFVHFHLLCFRCLVPKCILTGKFNEDLALYHLMKSRKFRLPITYVPLYVH